MSTPAQTVSPGLAVSADKINFACVWCAAGNAPPSDGSAI